MIYESLAEKITFLNFYIYQKTLKMYIDMPDTIKTL